MARIRTIKPEFWTNEALSELPEATHMLAAALLNYADDEGYFNANPKLVQAACSPLREPSVSIPESLRSLQTIGYIRLGKGADGRQYGQIVEFQKHQKVSHATPSKIPVLSITWENSGNSPEPSRNPPEVLRPEGNREGNREQGREKEEGRAEARGEYAFVGKVIRLKPKDLERWRKDYHAVPDITAELRAADDYYAEHPLKDGKWFFAASKWLKREHDKRLLDAKPLPDPYRSAI